MIDIENLEIEIQTRADALTGTPTDEQVLEVGIAARSVELAGGSISRTVLDVAIQNVIDSVSGAAENADLIALGATLPRPAAVAGSIDVGTYVTGLFKGNSKYLQCNNGTYLRSAYPELTDLMLSDLSQQVSISESEGTNISSLNSAHETQSSVYKVNSKYYKLSGGTSSSGGWGNIPIQSSTDGTVYSPVSISSVNIPGGSTDYQMDVLVASGTTLIAFGRMTSGGSYSLVQLKSLDDGRTWSYSVVRGTTNSHTTVTNPILAAIIGNTVMIHPRRQQATSVYYSTNLGSSWTTLTDTDAQNTKYINGLIQDGTRFIVGFTDGSSAYSATSDPAGTTWTAVTPPSAYATGVLAVVGTKWVMGGATGYVATSTTPGTWITESTCTSGMPGFSIERILVNGSTIAFSELSTTSQIFYCSDASTLPAVVSVVADGVVGSPNKLVLASVADGNIYIRQEAGGLLLSTTLTPGSFTPVQIGLDNGNIYSFNTVNYSTVKKYGFYFCSVGGTGYNKRYMSTDLKAWVSAPADIAVGCGPIVDAGTRLLTLDSSQLLWQSTDGRTWNTTGITRPTLTGSVYASYARLHVCTNGWIYYTVFRDTASSYYVYVSKNNGSTWTSISGLPLAGSDNRINALSNPCLFKEINSTIYSLSVNYFSSSYGYYLSKSTDGINFTFVTGASNSLSNADYTQRNGVFEVDGIIYVFVGSDAPVWLASYDDGVNFTPVPASFAPASLVQLVTTTTQFITNNLSSADLLYVRTAVPETLVKLSGSGLTSSSNYAIGINTKSPVFIYEDSGINMVTSSTFSAPKLIRLDDTNTTFTLPNITNTWLRASS